MVPHLFFSHENPQKIRSYMNDIIDVLRLVNELSIIVINNTIQTTKSKH